MIGDPDHRPFRITQESMDNTSARLSLGFSCIGHLFSHLFAPIFFVAALSLEAAMNMSHGEVVVLIVFGNVLYGVMAPLAGWLSDKWSATGMMGLYFIGTGIGMTMTGFADTPFQIAVGLAVSGIFGSIYHPVGFAWLVRHAVKRGMALGVNGVFGAIGPAVASLMAGALIGIYSWRAAFILPGVIIFATGIVFYVLIYRGIIVETRVDRHSEDPPSRQDRVRAFLVMVVTMLCTGLIYQATQPALPKLFSERLTDLSGSSVFGVSLLVALVYFVAGAMQLVVGRMADKYPLRKVYFLMFFLQVPFLMLAGSLSGTPLFAAALVMVAANVSSLPAENYLVARYAPSKWRGLVFGLKFIISFGIGGLGVMIESTFYNLTGGFSWMFMVLAALSVVGGAAALLLPAENRNSASQAV